MRIKTLIVGGGPGGIAPLIAASRSTALGRILADGIAIAERGHRFGGGRMGDYAINSDSSGKTLASCVFETHHPLLAALRTHPAVTAVAAYGDRAVPLALVHALLTTIGDALQTLLSTSGNPLFLRHEAVSIAQDHTGHWRTTLRRLPDDARIVVSSRFVVVATGGHQPLSVLTQRRVGGQSLLPTYAAKLMQSDEALTPAGLKTIGDRLAASHAKKVAIIGSSSSAMACAVALLGASFGRKFDSSAVTLLHRRPLRLFYPSAAAAQADGYSEFDSDDICPISGFVFRLSGFRLEARELLMAVRGMAGRARESRLRLHQVGAEADPVTAQILEEADVIIAALGYRPRALRIENAAGTRIPLQADEAGAALVDDQCRILDRQGRPIDGLLGIGLGSGFFARDMVGGERSFDGQSNSLWQWQNGIGELIACKLQGAFAMERSNPITSSFRSSESEAVVFNRDSYAAG